jgi:outer membrane protein
MKQAHREKVQWTTVVAMALLATGTIAASDIAVVDRQRALQEYHKTARANAEIGRQKTELKAEITRMRETFKVLETKFEAAREASHNKALSDDALEKKLQEAEKALMALKEHEHDVVRVSQEGQKALIDQSMRITKRFMDEINDAIRKYAKRKGLLLVVDSSGALADKRELVIFYDEAIDITDEVIWNLNKGTDTSKTPAKK